MPLRFRRDLQGTLYWLLPSVETFKTCFKQDGSDPISVFSLYFREKFTVHSLEREREEECSDGWTDGRTDRRTGSVQSYVAGSVPSNGVPMNLSAWGINKEGGTQKKGRYGRQSRP